MPKTYILGNLSHKLLKYDPDYLNSSILMIKYAVAGQKSVIHF